MLICLIIYVLTLGGASGRFPANFDWEGALQGQNCSANAALSAQKTSTKFVGVWDMFDPAFKIFYQGWKAATEAFEGHYLVINNQDRRSGPKRPPRTQNAVQMLCRVLRKLQNRQWEVWACSIQLQNILPRLEGSERGLPGLIFVIYN